MFSRRTIVAVLAACAALVAAPSALADAEFQDPTGDAGGAMDVTRVVVANDAFNRVIFVVSVPGVNSMPKDGFLTLVVDADQRVDTGNNGVDYAFVLDGEDSSWELAAWNGDTWNFDAPSATVKVSLAAGVLMIGVDRAELGNTSAFDFWFTTSKHAGDQIVGSDVVPDGGAVWSYSFVTKRLSLVAGPAAAVPKRPVPGKQLAVGYVFGRADSPEAATGARGTCVAMLGTARLAARVVVQNDVAVCTFRLPVTAKGKRLKVTLTVTYRGAKVARTYTTTIR